MGFVDTIRKAASGKRNEIDKGVDAVAKFARGRAPAKYDSKISAAAMQVKKAAGKLAAPSAVSRSGSVDDLHAADRPDVERKPSS